MSLVASHKPEANKIPVILKSVVLVWWCGVSFSNKEIIKFNTCSLVLRVPQMYFYTYSNKRAGVSPVERSTLVLPGYKIQISKKYLLRWREDNAIHIKE